MPTTVFVMATLWCIVMVGLAVVLSSVMKLTALDASSLIARPAASFVLITRSLGNALTSNVDLLVSASAVSTDVGPLLISTVPKAPVPPLAMLPAASTKLPPAPVPFPSPAVIVTVPPAPFVPPPACPVIAVSDPPADACAGRTIDTALSFPSVYDTPVATTAPAWSSVRITPLLLSTMFMYFPVLLAPLLIFRWSSVCDPTPVTERATLFVTVLVMSTFWCIVILGSLVVLSSVMKLTAESLNSSAAALFARTFTTAA